MKPRFLILTLLAGLLPAAHVHAQNKDLAALVEGNNQFALDMYQQLGKKPGNKFFSPYSISSALGMTYAGAKGETAQEMARALHFTLENEQMHPVFGELIRTIQGTDKKREFQLTTANSLWGNKSNFTLNANFLRITQTDYQAGFHLVDFVGDPAGARKKINGWVEDRTNDKIKDLLTADAVTPQTRLILVNAIYFKGAWSSKFSKNATWPEEFTNPGSPPVKVPTMHKISEVQYHGNDDFQVAQLPYGVKGSEASMVILLPRKKDGLAALEKKLSLKMLNQAIAQLKWTDVDMSLPKFKLTEEFVLNDELMALGMKAAFDARADFSGMEQGSRTLFIQRVVHKAFVDVNEDGTEAAAATAVVMDKKESAKEKVVPPPPVPFKADHPFLFLVRHNTTGSILFMGRVYNPR